MLQLHKTPLLEDWEDYSLPETISVYHAPLEQTVREAWINSKQIDAVIVGPDSSISDIVSIRETVTRSVVPLILHTFKYDWKAKEIAFESEVDEYHIGPLDQHFIKRLKFIKRIKSFTIANQNQQRLSDKGANVKFWLLKRSFDIVISVVVILLLLPLLMMILPLLTLETEGSILSTRKIVGRNYKIFNLYKFRSFPSTGDKVSPIWRFLRKAHLIGLPQVLNVLKGDMSIVGTYPVRMQDAEKSLPRMRLPGDF